MPKAHPGFKAVQAKIAAKEGVSKNAAGAILANASRHASPKAKAANPRLARVSHKSGDPGHGHFPKAHDSSHH